MDEKTAWVIKSQAEIDQAWEALTDIYEKNDYGFLNKETTAIEIEMCRAIVTMEVIKRSRARENSKEKE